MRHLRTHVAAVILSVLLAPYSIADDAELRQRFQEDAPRGWERLAEWDGGVECEGTLSVKFARTGEGWHALENETRELKYRRRGEAGLVEQFNPRPRQHASEHLVFAVNPRYGFIITKERGKKQWRVRLLKQGASSSEVAVEMAGRFYAVFKPAFSYGEVRLADLIQDPTFRLKTVERVKQGGADCAKVSCSFVHPADPRKTKLRQEGWFLCDPSNHWAVMESETWTQDGRGRTHCVVEYAENAVDGCKPYKRVVTTGKGPTAVRVEEFVFTKCNRKDIEQEAFTLSAYGLPDITEPATRNNPVLRTIVVFLAAFVCLVGAVLIRKRMWKKG